MLKIGSIWFAGSLAILAISLGIVLTLTSREYGRGFALEEELGRRYEGLDAYRLPADGRTPPDRVARFLAVRRALAPKCPEITGLVGAFVDVRTTAEGHDPDVPDLFGKIGRAVRRIPSLGVAFGEYVTGRNRALAAEGMGLGEYSWLYVASYFALLGQQPIPALDREGQATLFERRIYPDIARLVGRHVEETNLTGGPWVEELARLRADRSRVPFRGALPPEVAAPFEPARTELAATACPAAAELDLTTTVRRGRFWYDHQ